MLFSTASGWIEKDIPPGMTMFFMHSMAIPNAQVFKRISEVSIVKIDE